MRSCLIKEITSNSSSDSDSIANKNEDTLLENTYKKGLGGSNSHSEIYQTLAKSYILLHGCQN